MYQPSIDPELRLTRYLLASRAFEKAPVRVIDGGSRWGGESHWVAYRDQIEVFAFEPDEKECRRLNELHAGQGGFSQKHLPVALGRKKGQATLNIARFPDSSSLLKNNDALLSRFAMAEYVEQIGEATVDLTDVESLMAENRFEYIDFMKLDVEGAELDVLEGAEKALADSLLGLSVEVWFHAEHLGRPLFGDIDAYLRRAGFVLFDLREINRWRRKTQCGDGYPTWIGSGQLMYANALYFRDIPGLLASAAWKITEQSRMRVLKLASLAELFCYPDFAIEVLQSAERAGILDPREATTLVSLLARSEASAARGWKPFVRASVRAMLPPILRRKLMRALQGLVSEA